MYGANGTVQVARHLLLIARRQNLQAHKPAVTAAVRQERYLAIIQQATGQQTVGAHAPAKAYVPWVQRKALPAITGILAIRQEHAPQAVPGVIGVLPLVPLLVPADIVTMGVLV